MRKTKCSQPKAAFKCNYLVASGQVCNRMFANIYQLRKQRQMKGHLRKTKKSQIASFDPLLQQYTQTETQEPSDLCPPATESCVYSNGGSDDEELQKQQMQLDPLEESEDEEIEIDSCDEEGLVEDVDLECCVMCTLTEDVDQEPELWVECSQCSSWVYDSCLPPNDPFSAKDDDFLCPLCCGITKKPRRSA